MLYKVSEIAKAMGLSKVTIYNRVNTLQNELKPYIRHKKGVQYIDDKGLLILKKSCGLKVDDDALQETAASKAQEQDISDGLKQFESLNKSIESLKNSVNSEYVQALKNQIEDLKTEIENKNRQLDAKDRLLENFQVMLQSERQSRLQLEAAREEREKKMDTFISEWRQDRREREEKKGFFKKLFNK